MALGASCVTGIGRRRPGYAEKAIAGERGDGGLGERGGGAHGLPTGGMKRVRLEKLVVARRARRPRPRHVDAIGKASNPGHDGPPGHPPGLSDGQMGIVLRAGGPARHAQKSDGQAQDPYPGNQARSSVVHKPPIVLPQTISAWRRQKYLHLRPTGFMHPYAE